MEHFVRAHLRCVVEPSNDGVPVRRCYFDQFEHAIVDGLARQDLELGVREVSRDGSQPIVVVYPNLELQVYTNHTRWSWLASSLTDFPLD